jgi:predicted ATPase
VLDNAEHVVEPLAPRPRLVDRGSAGGHFVVTSREILRVQGEHVLAIGPLTVPPRDAKPNEIAASEAVSLFTARIAQVQPSFQMTPADAPTIAEIVRPARRDPLAIELGGRARAHVVARRDPRALPRRFDLLSSARRDTSARHATLRRAIDWSWGLLLPWERMALACTAVFSGGFDLDAAEAIVDLGAWRDAPLTLDVIQALVDKSLLRAGAHPRLARDPVLALREHPRVRRGSADDARRGRRARRAIRVRARGGGAGDAATRSLVRAARRSEHADAGPREPAPLVLARPRQPARGDRSRDRARPRRHRGRGLGRPS